MLCHIAELSEYGVFPESTHRWQVLTYLKDRIYELNAHERQHNVVNMSEKLRIFLKPQSVRVWGMSVRNMAEYHNTNRYLAVTLSDFSIYNEVS